MIERILRRSFAKPVLTVLLALAAAAAGAVWLSDLRRDVFPDLSTPVFNVIVQNAAMGAEELETGVAIPLETALAGLPEVRRIRSTSQLGVAQVRVEFEPDADYYRSRQLVAERVNQVARELPPGTEAPLVSSLTGRLNEIMEFTLEAGAGLRRPDDAARSGGVRGAQPAARRARRRGRRAARRVPAAVPGAARSGAHGGALGVTLDEVLTAVRRSNENAVRRLRDSGPDRVDRARRRPRRQRRPTCAPPWSRCATSTPVLLGDVADVREAPAVRRGIAHRLGRRSSAAGWSSSSAPTRWRSPARRARRGLRGPPPAACRPGVRLRVVYDQSELVRLRPRRRRPGGAARRRCSSWSCSSCCSATCARR